MQHWHPTQIERYIRSAESSTRVARVRTDAGDAYMKALGNPEGPHALVREYVGTALAEWFGLPTFEYAIVEHDGVVDVPVGNGEWAQPGPAFLTRAHEGHPWSGGPKDLEKVENVEVFAGLVVFDTWVRNRDRCPPQEMDLPPNRDNVFLSEEEASPGMSRLIAMDFTHCFQESSSLSRHISSIANIQDNRIYGFFPAFRDYLNADTICCAKKRFAKVNQEVINGILNRVPKGWELDARTRAAVGEFLVQRARYLDDRLADMLYPYSAEQGELEMS